MKLLAACTTLRGETQRKDAAVAGVCGISHTGAVFSSLMHANPQAT